MVDIIKYGNHITLKHNQTGRVLTSNGGFNYAEGSGQQAVFGAWEHNEEASFIVIPGLESEAERDDDVNFGEVIRLKHVPTRANLHSHAGISSPVTGQQEVTCFGNDETTDENDEWVVDRWGQEEDNDDYDHDDPTWYTGRSFVLRHRQTGVALHTHDIIMSDDRTEVTGFSDGPDENDRWRAHYS